MKEIEIPSRQKFAEKIIKLMHENDLNIIDTIVSFCEDNDLDMADIIPLLDKNLKERIRVAAIENRYVLSETVTQLPL